MRTGCKHYESRTYASGESVRKCNLDLAPEAPWRCPDNCPAFAPRLVDAGWAYGGLAATKSPGEPEGLDADAAALLDEAEDVVNAVGPDILAEFQKQDRRQGRQERSLTASWWKQLRPRRR